MPYLLPSLFIAFVSSSGALADSVQNCEGHNYSVKGDFKLICSATWRFTAKCVGRDMWADWTVGGRTTPSGPFVRPWLDVPIEIVGYELVKIPGFTWSPRQAYLNYTRSWFMVGSTIQPDGMIWMGPGESHAKQIWPSGHGQLWPAQDQALALQPIFDDAGKPSAFSGDLIDLHGQCYGGIDMQLLLTVYYSPMPSPN